MRLCGGFIYPTVRVVDSVTIRGSIASISEMLWLNWTAHMPLGLADWPLTAAALRPRLAELRDNAGRYICPPLAPRMDLAELRCFDPNNCDCVKFQDLRYISSFGGHTDPTQCLFPRGASSQPRQDLQLRRSEKCEYQARLHGICRFDLGIYGPGNLNVQIRPCHSGGRCLVVDYSRSFRVGSKGRIDPHWFQALDPESYNLTSDKEGLGVYWCRQ